MFARGAWSFQPARLPASPKNISSSIILTLARPSRKSNHSCTSAIPGDGGYTGFLVRPIRYGSKPFVSPTYAKTGDVPLWKMSARRHFLPFLATHSPCVPRVRSRAIASHQLRATIHPPVGFLARLVRFSTLLLRGPGPDAEAIQGFVGKRDCRRGNC